jgi:hypothetical protein
MSLVRFPLPRLSLGFIWTQEENIYLYRWREVPCGGPEYFNTAKRTLFFSYPPTYEMIHLACMPVALIIRLV